MAARILEVPDKLRLLEILAPIQDKFQQVGLALGVPDYVLNKTSTKSDILKLNDVLDSWLETKGNSATWEILLVAIEGPIVENQIVGDKIREHLGLKDTISEGPKLVDLLKSMTIEDDQQIEINCKVFNADTNELIQSTRDPLTRDIKIACPRPPRVQEFSSDAVKVGTSIRLEISSDSDCYLYVLNVGTSGKTSLLLPNEFERDHYFHANQTYYLLGEDFGFEIKGPSGKETIQVLAFSQKQSDLDKLYGEIICEKELYRDITVRRKTKFSVDKKGYAQVQFDVIV